MIADFIGALSLHQRKHAHALWALLPSNIANKQPRLEHSKPTHLLRRSNKNRAAVIGDAVCVSSLARSAISKVPQFEGQILGEHTHTSMHTLVSINRAQYNAYQSECKKEAYAMSTRARWAHDHDCIEAALRWYGTTKVSRFTYEWDSTTKWPMCRCIPHCSARKH